MIMKLARRSKKISTIFTIGHSTRPIAEFLALLQQVDVDLLVDVRSIPRSRTNPQFNADALPETLAAAGISYQHLPALGGLRHRKKGAPTSLNTFWHVAAFRNYADYAATEAFRTGLNELRALSRDNCCAIMCAEAVWWRSIGMSTEIFTTTALQMILHMNARYLNPVTAVNHGITVLTLREEINNG